MDEKTSNTINRHLTVHNRPDYAEWTKPPFAPIDLPRIHVKSKSIKSRLSSLFRIITITATEENGGLAVYNDDEVEFCIISFEGEDTISPHGYLGIVLGKSPEGVEGPIILQIELILPLNVKVDAETNAVSASCAFNVKTHNDIDLNKLVEAIIALRKSAMNIESSEIDEVLSKTNLSLSKIVEHSEVVLAVHSQKCRNLFYLYCLYYFIPETIKEQVSVMDENLDKINNSLLVVLLALTEKINEMKQNVQVKTVEKNDDPVSIVKTKFEAKREAAGKEICNVFDKEINRINSMTPHNPEFTKILDYIEYIADIPFGVFSDTNVSIKKLKEQMASSHFGLTDVKSNIAEHLALQKVASEAQGQVICLVGPPGVGKTSLANTLAKVTGRTFIRMALGGVSDEAELRGHKRTYIGSEPGRLVKELIKAGSMDPVIVLDEVDKMGRGLTGSPLDALLELLDPEQNTRFVDRYLSIGIDLSKALFICTANYEQQIPEALKDRMEIIRIKGYNSDEQKTIIEQYILPKFLNKYKLNNIVSLDESLINLFISKEPTGMRNAERLIQQVLRKAAARMVEETEESPDQNFNLNLNVDNCKTLINFDIKPIKGIIKQVGFMNNQEKPLMPKGIPEEI